MPGAATALAQAPQSAPQATQVALGGMAEIAIRNFKFEPETITVAKGTSITWVNKDEEPHNLVSLDRAFRSKAIDGGDKFTAVMNQPGTYKYICAVHPHMRGTIVVQ